MILATDPFRYILPNRSPIRQARSMPIQVAGRRHRRGAGAFDRRSLRDYAREKLFLPIDAPDFEWLDAGVSGKLGAFGSLRMRPRDAVARPPVADGRRVERPPGAAGRLGGPIARATHQRRGAVLLRISMVARPIVPQRRATDCTGWPAAVCRRRLDPLSAFPPATTPRLCSDPGRHLPRIVLPAIKDRPPAQASHEDNIATAATAMIAVAVQPSTTCQGAQRSPHRLRRLATIIMAAMIGIDGDVVQHGAPDQRL